MNDLATRTAAPLIAATSRRLGVDLPKPVAEALEAATKLRDSAWEQRLGDTTDVATAVAEAIWADRDPLASKAVHRALLATQLSHADVEAALRNHADQHTADAIIEHADAIIDTWRPAVERAEQAFARFREMAPGVDPLDQHLPAGLPVRALTPWGEAKEGAALIEQVAKGWHAFATVGAARLLHNTRPLIVADLTLEQLEGLGTRAKVEHVAALDVTIELASIETFTNRVDRLERARAERADYEAAAPERAREERRRTLAIAKIPGAARL
jgi:hypothetical protein